MKQQAFKVEFVLFVESDGIDHHRVKDFFHFFLMKFPSAWSMDLNVEECTKEYNHTILHLDYRPEE